MKLTKHEREQIEHQMTPTPVRQDTWVGIRPVVFGSKKYSTKQQRQENKRVCREYTAEKGKEII